MYNEEQEFTDISSMKIFIPGTWATLTNCYIKTCDKSLFINAVLLSYMWLDTITSELVHYNTLENPIIDNDIIPLNFDIFKVLKKSCCHNMFIHINFKQKTTFKLCYTKVFYDSLTFSTYTFNYRHFLQNHYIVQSVKNEINGININFSNIRMYGDEIIFYFKKNGFIVESNVLSNLFIHYKEETLAELDELILSSRSFYNRGFYKIKFNRYVNYNNDREFVFNLLFNTNEEYELNMIVITHNVLDSKHSSEILYIN